MNPVAMNDWYPVIEMLAGLLWIGIIVVSVLLAIELIWFFVLLANTLRASSKTRPADPMSSRWPAG